MPDESPRKRPRPYRKSGFYTLRRAVVTLGSRALPPKSTLLGRELHEWRQSLVDDLGGDQAVTTAQMAMIDMAVRSKLLLDSVDSYVLGLDSLVNKQKRTLFGIVKERSALVSQLQSLLRDLGLERRVREPDVAAILARLHEPTPPAE